MKILVAIIFLTFSSMQPQTETTIKITIGPKVFHATLYDNETTKAIKALLPMTVNMTELNGNEKYFHLPVDKFNSSRHAKSRGFDALWWE